MEPLGHPACVVLAPSLVERHPCIDVVDKLLYKLRADAKSRSTGKDKQGTTGKARHARHEWMDWQARQDRHGRTGTTSKAGKAGKADAQQTIDGWFFNIATISVSSRRNRNVACERNASLLPLSSCVFFVPSLSWVTIEFHENRETGAKERRVLSGCTCGTCQGSSRECAGSCGSNGDHMQPT